MAGHSGGAFAGNQLNGAMRVEAEAPLTHVNVEVGGRA
jgi:hypothetical protein